MANTAMHYRDAGEPIEQMSDATEEATHGQLVLSKHSYQACVVTVFLCLFCTVRAVHGTHAVRGDYTLKEVCGRGCVSVAWCGSVGWAHLSCFVCVLVYILFCDDGTHHVRQLLLADAATLDRYHLSGEELESTQVFSLLPAES